MKKLLFLCLLVQSSLLFSQVPQAINYQAVARDSSGKILIDYPIKVKNSILQGSIDGIPVYVEEHNLITSKIGVLNIEIGTGTPVVNTFSSILWGNNKYYLKLELDITGNGYAVSGVSQLLSVPYALYADKAKTTDQIVQLNGSNNVSVSGSFPDFIVKGSPSLTQQEIDALTPYDGMIVHNKTTNCINYYFNESWSELCGTCAPKPSIAVAGIDQLGLSGTSTSLNATIPLIGTGLWTIVSGDGGSFDNASSPVASFTGTPGVQYVLRWTVSNKCSSSFDEVAVNFQAVVDCGFDITDGRNNLSYKTVKIGTQCWMAENLNIGTYVESTYAVNTVHSDVTDNGIIEKYCRENKEANCAIYGGLYDWNEMMQYLTPAQGICMSGWHIPSDAEWTTLTDFLGGLAVAGDKMKEPGTTHWAGLNTTATNESGFTAFGAGLRDLMGDFIQIGEMGLWWSSSFTYRSVNYADGTVYKTQFNKAGGLSVRCIKN